MSISPTTSIHHAPDAVSRVVAGEALIVDLKSGHYFGLDPVGTRVWELIAQKGTFGGIFDAMREEFDVDEDRLLADLERLVGEMLAGGLVRLSDSSG